MNTQTTQTQAAPTAEETATARHAEMMNANRILYSEIQELKKMIAALMLQQAEQQQPAAAPIAGQLSFNAETLSATVDDGKAYWKVKGGQYQKFGVIVWPEVLEDAGINPDELNPLQPVDVSHLVAVCTVKENGQPKKVIRLEPKQ